MRATKHALQAWSLIQGITRSLENPCSLKQVLVASDPTKVRRSISSLSVGCCKSVVQAQRSCYSPCAHSKRNFCTHLDGLGWGTPRVWLPSKVLSEWALRPGHHVGVAILNAFQTAGGHVHRMLPIMLAEGFRQDRSAACLAGPRLRCTLETLGPAFIKWGQWAATRRDVFPPDLCKELERLHSHGPQHSLRFTHSAIRRAFAGSAEDLFQQFEERPVASGSIAQVYRARLSQKGALHTGMDAGTEVAVKVRHPGVVRAIRRDFALMLRLAGLASLLPGLRGLRLEETLAQFAAPLQEQVDLSLEAENLLQFNLNFKKHAAVCFPVPIYPLVAPEVLVETFQEGDSISRYIAEGAGASLYDKQLATLGHRVMLKMMLQDNFIHSDLHPGNIMVRLDPPSNPLLQAATKLCSIFGGKSPEDWMQPRIVLLDVGMVTRLSTADQQNMVKLFQSLLGMDGQGIANAALSFSGEKQTCTDPCAFAASLAAHLDTMNAARWSDTQYSSASEALSAVLELVRQHEVSLPGHICAVVVTTLVLEGWSSKLDPDQSLLDDIGHALHASKLSIWRQQLAHMLL
ncbi:hypothetical protein ABBQ38_008372 [Trebouxia sp. C0009 RCD-2024]